MAEIGDVIVTRKDYERRGRGREREETGTEIMQILCKSRNGVTLIRVTISKVIGRIDVVSSSPFLPTPLPPPTGKQPEVLVSRYDFTISFFILLSGETDRRNVRPLVPGGGSLHRQIPVVSALMGFLNGGPLVRCSPPPYRSSSKDLVQGAKGRGAGADSFMPLRWRGEGRIYLGRAGPLSARDVRACTQLSWSSSALQGSHELAKER